MQQYQTQGTPFWITSSQNLGSSYPYPIYARVAYDAGSGMQIWESVVGSNTSTPGADANWVLCNVFAVGNPPGTIIDFAGTAAPTGYLLCDNTSYPTSTYPNLFAAIGYTWGGSGANFNVPSLQTRVCAGAGGSGIPIPGGTPSSIINVGDKGGASTHLIITNELSPHSHTTTTYGPSGSSATGPGTRAVIEASPNHALTSTDTPAGGTQTAMTIVQATALTLKCIKY